MCYYIRFEIIMSTPNTLILPPIDFTPYYAELIEANTPRITLLHPVPGYTQTRLSRDAFVEILPIAQGLKAQERAAQLHADCPNTGSDLVAFQKHVEDKRWQLTFNLNTKNAPHTVRRAFQLGILALSATSDFDPRQNRPRLTKVELEALYDLSTGTPAEEVGKRFSERRPHHYTSTLYKHLGARNVSAAVSMAYVYRLKGFANVRTTGLR
jgi:hypothetical protein